MTDDSAERRAQQEQVDAMPEGSQKELAEHMFLYSDFPDEPVFESTYDDTLIGLTYRAGGSFYKKGGKLLFYPMSQLELDNWWVDDHLKDPEYEKLIEISD